MADIGLYVGEDQRLPSGSGIGFFGDSGFGDPVSVNGYNGRTFVVNPSGTVDGFEANNNKFQTSTTVINGQSGSGILLLALPNTLATLNIRFTHSVAVRTQNISFYVYDGSSTNGVPNKTNDPTGLTAWCAEIRHTDERQIANGLGDATWQDTHGAVALTLVDSPATSGLRPSGLFSEDTRHDWYVAMSVSPTQYGDKFFGILVETEFL